MRKPGICLRKQDIEVDFLSMYGPGHLGQVLRLVSR